MEHLFNTIAANINYDENKPLIPQIKIRMNELTTLIADESKSDAEIIKFERQFDQLEVLLKYLPADA